MGSDDTSVVLVHAAWADGSSWARVIDGLATAGLKAVAAPLPLTSLADDVAALRRVIERTQGPVVLVGHAYSGAVIGAVRHASVKALVYLNALVPEKGETVLDVFSRSAPHPLAPQVSPDTDGLIWLPEEAFAQAFAQQVDAREQAILAAVQRPISIQCITAQVERPTWHDLPSWYLVAEEDRMISADNQRAMAERIGATISSLPLDHCPMLGAPGRVVEMILAAAKA
ncbi:MAG: alpha/beta hydrolase [Sphingomonadales bacterium]|nr:alpha/beta hydrolase [Sphingomonadales bacterium]MDE2170295.1 alpha/beta hydrolase [Sphingomonadales bacterium]